MSDQWINDLRNKMNDHQIDVPEGLWEDVKIELFKKNEEEIILFKSCEDGKRTGGFSFNSFFNKKIAAVIILFFTVGGLLSLYLVNSHDKDGKYSFERYEKVENNHVSSDGNLHKSLHIKKEKFLNSYTLSKQKIYQSSILHNTKNEFINVVSGNYQNENMTIEELQTQSQIDEELLSQHISGELALKNEEFLSNKVLSGDIKDSASLDDIKEIAVKNEKKIKSKWMANILTGTMSAPTSSSDLSSLVQSISEAENPLEVVSENDLNFTVRNKIPINFGFSLQRIINKKWSFSTGLSYRFFSSEITSGSDSRFMKKVQKTHYIILPIQVNYKLLEKGPFVGYASTGLDIRKSISDRSKTEFFVNQIKESIITEKADAFPYDFALKTSLGAQLRLTDQIGLYVEPGLEYNLQNRQNQNFINTAKPLNIRVDIGLRLLINHKK